MDNPWQVDSIKAFACLKCPECAFNTNIENNFTDHAVENHPLSFVLFGKSEEVTKVKMEEGTENSWSIFSYINENVEPIQVKNETIEPSPNVEENINNANPDTGKSLSEALIFAEHEENMLCTEIVFDIQNNLCTQHVLPMFCKNKSF